ncbi:transposable element Tcb1 transposase isoform X2 [Rhizophagus clarus]|nr:transposable element Tcb1 transposase isoform X2 [Rhizophagus clarus]
MCSIYERGLIPSACELFGIDSIDWILQEDNDPKYRSKICKKWKEENEVTVLPWPSMSPDQNPIENAQLAREWNQLSEDLAKNLVNSMKRRVTALIEAGGDFTMY